MSLRTAKATTGMWGCFSASTTRQLPLLPTGQVREFSLLVGGRVILSFAEFPGAAGPDQAFVSSGSSQAVVLQDMLTRSTALTVVVVLRIRTTAVRWLGAPLPCPVDGAPGAPYRTHTLIGELAALLPPPDQSSTIAKTEANATPAAVAATIPSTLAGATTIAAWQPAIATDMILRCRFRDKSTSDRRTTTALTKRIDSAAGKERLTLTAASAVETAVNAGGFATPTAVDSVRPGDSKVVESGKKEGGMMNRWCADGDVHVHRFVMCLRSPFFRAMFASGARWRDADEGIVHVDCDPRVVRALVQYMYVDHYGGTAGASDRAIVRDWTALMSLIRLALMWEVNEAAMATLPGVSQLLDAQRALEAIAVSRSLLSQLGPITPAVAPPKRIFSAGDVIEAMWNPEGSRTWYPGKIRRDAGGDRYDIAFDDGHSRQNVPANQVRRDRHDQVEDIDADVMQRALMQPPPRLSATTVGTHLFQMATAYLKLHVDEMFCVLGLHDIVAAATTPRVAATASHTKPPDNKDDPSQCTSRTPASDGPAKSDTPLTSDDPAATDSDDGMAEPSEPALSQTKSAKKRRTPNPPTIRTTPHNAHRGRPHRMVPQKATRH